MNETEYFKLLRKVVRESGKFGRVIIIVNKKSLEVENYSIDQILENLESKIKIRW